MASSVAKAMGVFLSGGGAPNSGGALGDVIPTERVVEFLVFRVGHHIKVFWTVVQFVTVDVVNVLTTSDWPP
jgi:uncharacterized membrane protein